MVSREDLLRRTHEEFAFLRQAEDGEPKTVERGTLLTWVAYMFATVGVELHFDWRDLEVDCYFSRPSGGGPPEGYLVRTSGGFATG